jgi:ketosteroid isomerase-like protein
METRQAIEKLNAEFVDAYNRGDIGEIATGYAEDRIC